MHTLLSIVFDVICLTETYLDSRILSHDPNLEIKGCDLIRANHPLKPQERWSLYLLQKLPAPETININFLHECLTVELNIKNKLCVLVAMYR